jgi:signal transduction histidine kinase
MEHSNLQVSVEISGEDWALAEMEELAVLRLVQEALTNTRKHARANTVNISLRYEARWLTVHIEDDGDGLPTHSSIPTTTRNQAQMGLAGMRERIELFNGTFGIGASPSGGTLVSALLPH